MGYSIDQDLEIMKEIERISQEPVNESQYTAVRHGGKPIVESMAVFDDVKVDFNKWTSDNKKVNKAKTVNTGDNELRTVFDLTCRDDLLNIVTYEVVFSDRAVVKQLHHFLLRHAEIRITVVCDYLRVSVDIALKLEISLFVLVEPDFVVFRIEFDICQLVVVDILSRLVVAAQDLKLCSTIKLMCAFFLSFSRQLVDVIFG